MMIENFKKVIGDVKSLRIAVLIALILLQSTVFIGAALDRQPQMGIIGGADGPTVILITEGEKSPLIEWFIKLLNGRNSPGSFRDNEGRKDGAAGGVPGGGSENEESPGHDAADRCEATEEQRREAEERGLLILINKQNPVDKSYKPDDLSSIKYYASDRGEAGRYMRKEAADQFHKLVEAAAEEGLKIVMTTAYRSYGFQQTLWNNYVANEGEAAASRFSAKPGQSEHQSGLAVDVSASSVDYALTDRFGKTKEGIWLAENAHNFGFIIRFPEGKEDVTGYLYEPWHIRYVGEPIAVEIYTKGLTLEEYLGE
ncbi:MAG TPA: D-alanyl-D-alanine carboxypeptidase family protein [Bacillota bacterium]|nr:D-alanyl-D-alanine carboxypeptidase family protein [Bacillota bacterium]